MRRPWALESQRFVEPETFGDDGTEDKHKRLELEYTCNGKATLVIGNIGERIAIDSQGNNRSDRVNRKTKQ